MTVLLVYLIDTAHPPGLGHSGAAGCRCAVLAWVVGGPSVEKGEGVGTVLSLLQDPPDVVGKDFVERVEGVAGKKHP
jgi:hypothetical protein